MQKIINSLLTMPILPMRGMVLFPKMVLHFDVGRESSILALNKAMDKDRILFFTAQQDIQDEQPFAESLHKVGVVAEIKQIVKSNNHLRVLVEGLYRAQIRSFTQDVPYFEGSIEQYPTVCHQPNGAANIALMRTIKDLFEEYSLLTPRMTQEVAMGALITEDPVYLVEYIALNMPIRFEQKQEILEETNCNKRMHLLIGILEDEISILKIEMEINEKVRRQADASQRDFYLREQMRIIASELGEEDTLSDDIDVYAEQVEQLQVTDAVRTTLYKELGRLKRLPPSSQEASVIQTWLDHVLALPWNTSTMDVTDVKAAKKQLEHDHYGMEKVKERILELIAVRQLAPEQKGQIICLVGPPGVGKTSIARSVATAMQRNYTRASLGGVHDESDIRGHRKTYIGAMPGRIITALQQAKSNNPLFLLDEIDKLDSNLRGDPASALLEVLDSEQNVEFRDHYIEVPFDLSNVLFFATANNLATIPRPLLDRMEIIELGSYSREDKYQIAKKHLLRKQLIKHGLLSQQLKITQAGYYAIIDYYTREAGVRNLERQIAKICRKVAMQIVSKEAATITVSAKNIVAYLGAHRFKQDDISKHNEIGLVNGLAWTSVGGELLQVETAIMPGRGKISLTGSLGDVMKESAQAAISFVRTCTEKYGIAPDFYKTKDIHIHVPEGAVPKDGPSAGVTITTALVSALSETPVRGDIAMTGEISLRGRVMAIGGLREKSMAAYRNGIKTIIIPESNVPDIEEVDDIIKEQITFIPVTSIHTVLSHALINKPKSHTNHNHKPVTSAPNASAQL